LRIFISYRRSDAPSASRQLAEALKARFGDDHVFLDTRDVAAGAEWRHDVVERVRSSDVVLAVIGPHWAAAAEERAHRSVLDPAAEDLVRVEIETAFASGHPVIPVLVDDAEMPARETLPRPFRPLADVQAQTLHHTSWQRDLDTLIDGLARRPAPPPAEHTTPLSALPEPAPLRRGRGRRTDAGRVACYLGEGSLVTILGSGANAVDRDGPWRSGGGSLPDTTDLARHLVRQFGVGSETDDLARISQYVCLLDGKVDLYRTLRELLVKAPCDPGSIHRFFARVPGRLRDMSRGGPQLLVTTNYDTALERAFDAVHEPYDLAVFVGSGDHKGRFVHVPWWDPGEDGPRPILVPNEYVDFPIDEDGTLERSVIVKLHGGAADLRNGGPHIGGDFVITEDDYIGYLTQGPVESLIPLQILNKLRDSHFLFLGYRVRDWTLRVFLKRIWSDQPLQARSWAVDPEPDVVEQELWEEFGVDVVEAPLARFTAEVARELEGPDEARATA
jgi:hypothetical protein